MISVIIPTYKEAATIAGTVLHTQNRARDTDYEIIIIDSSQDEATKTAVMSTPGAHYKKATTKGRGNQMNQGADVAHGDTLLFLHADTILPLEWDQKIEATIKNSADCGAFVKKFDTTDTTFWERIGLQLIQSVSNYKVRRKTEFLGDNAIFITKKTFTEVNGYSEPYLMEDVALSHALLRNKKYRVAVIQNPVITSPRRILQHGIIRGIRRLYRIRRAYARGVRDEELVTIYQS